MSNSTDQFRIVGEALFGPAWQRELGRRLNVNERQIRRWASGEYEPPPGVWADIAAMCVEQSEKLAAMAELCITNQTAES